MSNDDDDEYEDEYDDDEYDDHDVIKKRIETVIKKAEGGDVYSMKLMATLYTNNEYFPRDYIAAQAWLRKAAKIGEDDEAYKRLAKLLKEGNGIAQDLEESFDINEQLMFNCDLDAMAEVGHAYKLGLGVPKDEKKAAFYIKQFFDIETDFMREDKENEKKKGV